jgi:hypothetical protein
VIPSAPRQSVQAMPRLAAGTVDPFPSPFALPPPPPQPVFRQPSPMMIVPDVRQTSVWPLVLFVLVAIGVGIAIGIGFAT